MLKVLLIMVVFVFTVVDYVLARACSIDEALYFEDPEPETGSRINADDLLAIMRERANRLLAAIDIPEPTPVEVESDYNPQDYPELVAAANNGTLTSQINKLIREAC